MQLESLTMQALGPFAGTQVIEFSLLSGQALVLINGQTGSGKTTILDALCFAFYGESSGNGRAGKDMRCDYAAPDLPTCVCLDFRLGAKTYRVRRSPEQTRPKKRGEGTVTEKHSATLYELTGSPGKQGETGRSSDGKLIADGVNDVATRVKTLLQLDPEQFRHVVMLPQGQFRRFLEAQSDTREKILESLFGTKRYQQIAAELSQQQKTLRKALEKGDTQSQALLEHAGVERVEALDERIVATKARLSESTVKETAFAQAQKQAREQLEQAKALASEQQELATAQALAFELDAQAPAMQSVRQRLSFAALAKALEAPADLARAREAERKSTAQALIEANATLEGLVAKLEAAKLASIEQDALAPERKRLQDELARAQQLRQAVRQVQAAKLESSSLAQTLVQLETQASSASQQLALQQAELRDDQTRLEQLRRHAGQLDAAQQKLSAARKQSQDYASLTEGHQRLEQQAVNVEALKAEVREVKAAVLDAQETLAQAQRSWQEGQAGALAAKLEDGLPCPVCGSLEHPHLAPSSDDLPRQDELEALKKLLVETGESREASEARLHEASQALAVTRASVHSLSAQLGDLAELEQAAVDERLELAKRACDEATNALAAVEKLEASMASRCAKLEQAREAQAELDKGRSEIKLKLSASQTRVETLEQSIPEQLRSSSLLEQHLETRSAQLRELVEKHEAASRSAAQLSSEHSAQTRAVELRAEAERSASDKAKAAVQALAQAREEAGLADEEVWSRAQADIAISTELQAQLQAWERSVHAAKERLTRAQAADRGLPRPDLEALEIAAAQADARYAELVRATKEIESALQSDQKIKQDYENKSKAHAKLEARHQVVASVAALAEGKDTRADAKISFQRYVLAGYLDEVLSSASVRLLKMSEGRYTLRRRTEAAMKSQAAGLELEVVDAYTGKARGVSTLSGGESFQTALALSLGLADVATAEAGGIHLDTLFIDEGFGTLDPEALEKALEILTQLNQGGRMVAIISHVPELRRRIDARIDVHKSGDGSRTRVVTP